jgi:hypothetical protein
VTEGETSFLGLFSFGTCGVVVCEIMVKGDYCSVSSRVFTSHSICFTYFSIFGLSVWAYGELLFFNLISAMIPHGS